MTEEQRKAAQDVLDAVKDLMLPSDLDEILEWQERTQEVRMLIRCAVGRKSRVKRATIYVDRNGDIYATDKRGREFKIRPYQIAQAFHREKVRL